MNQPARQGGKTHGCRPRSRPLKPWWSAALPPRASRARSGGGGLSILEVIFAMAVLSLGFLFVLGIVPTGVRSIKKSEDIAAATAYSVELVEDARRNMPSAGAQRYTITMNNTEFTMAREIYRVDAALTDIVVTASWLPNTPEMRFVTRVRGQPPSPSPR